MFCRSLKFSWILEIQYDETWKILSLSPFQSGNFAEEMMPTIGFQMRRVTKGNVAIKMWDLGGQKRFRSMWGRYCRGVDVIIFMVDAADEDNFDVSSYCQPQSTSLSLWTVYSLGEAEEIVILKKGEFIPQFKN